MCSIGRNTGKLPRFNHLRKTAPYCECCQSTKNWSRWPKIKVAPNVLKHISVLDFFWNPTTFWKSEKNWNCPLASKHGSEKMSRSALQRLRNVAYNCECTMWTIYKRLSGLWDDHREKKLLDQKVQCRFTFIFSFWLYISCVPSYIGSLICTWLTQNNDILYYRSYVEIQSVY